jgi:hypothetical protein
VAAATLKAAANVPTGTGKELLSKLIRIWERSVDQQQGQPYGFQDNVYHRL